MTGKQEAEHPDVDPVEFLRALMHISKEDAEDVRKDAAKKGTKADSDEAQRD